MRLSMHYNKMMVFVIGCTALLIACGGTKDSLSTKITIPSGKEARTQNDVYREEYKWMLRNVSPERHEALPEYTEFLQNVCSYFTHQSSDDLQDIEAMGEKLVSNNIDEPLVLIWYGNILFESKNYDEAKKFLLKGLERIEEKPRSNINVFFAAKNLARIQGYETNNECLSDSIENLALDALHMSVKSGEFKETEIPIVISMLKQVMVYPFQDIWKGFRDRIISDTEIDPWLKYVVEGSVEIDEAWEDRGSGWASTVTEEGWKGFRSHLKKASDALTKAWQLHPEYPQAPANMITVAQGGYASEELWFSRAVAAQMDYNGAYNVYLDTALPRWGGSYEKMLEFGEICLATKRFDTDVPMYYLFTAREAAGDLENYRWRAIFRRKDVGDNLDLLFEGMLEEESRKHDVDRILTQRAFTEMWRGNYEKAKRLFGDVKSEVDLSEGFCGKALSWGRRDRATINTELRAFTGPYGEILKKAENLSIENSPKSIPLFTEAMNKYQNDNDIFLYLRRRIALHMSGCRASVAPSDVSAMHIVAKERSKEAIQFLLDHGADVNARNRAGDTPLHYAAINGYTEICEQLINNKADMNAVNNQNRTSLFQACIMKQEETARFLVERGSDVNIPDNVGYQPLHISIRYNLPDTAGMLIENNSMLQEMTIERWVPLHFAIYYKEPRIAIDLINKGVDVNFRNGKGYSPLMLAVYNGYPEIVQRLIEEGTDIEAKSPEKGAALHIAAEFDRPEIIRILLENGANVNSKNPSDMTPLETARHFKNARCIDILEKEGE
jgi:ankyrin repeat protein